MLDFPDDAEHRTYVDGRVRAYVANSLQWIALS
jgi:hypothetical protein